MASQRRNRLLGVGTHITMNNIEQHTRAVTFSDSPGNLFVDVGVEQFNHGPNCGCQDGELI